MCSNTAGGPEAVFAALKHLAADTEALGGSSFDAMSELDAVAVCEQLTAITRGLAACQYELVNQLAERAVASDIGGSLARVMADRLKIRPGAARRMIAEARQLAYRRGLTGERLAPLWPTTAAKVRAGAIGAEHVAVIRDFFHQLPALVGF